MLLVRILGIFDAFVLAAILLMGMDAIGWRLGFTAGLYLVMKGIYFFSDWNSIADIICGCYIFLLLIGFHSWFTYLVIIYLGQKVFFSMV